MPSTLPTITATSFRVMDVPWHQGDEAGEAARHRRERLVAELDLDEEPRRAVADDQQVDLALFPVPQVAERGHPASSCVDGHLHILREVADVLIGELAAEQVHPAATGDDRSNLVGMCIEEPLQELLPPRVLVELVEYRHRRAFHEPAGAMVLGPGRRSRQNPLSIVEIVPVEICIRMRAAGRRLSDLPGATDERHLAVPGQVVPEDPVVDSRGGLHLTITGNLVKWSSPFGDGLDSGRTGAARLPRCN